VATSVIARFGVVAATTVLAVSALGGVAGAATHGTAHDQHSKSNGNGVARSHATRGTAGTSGSVTQPQPISTADANSGGANGQCTGGPYCSTRDGSPSGNGNGKGAAVGKPCAGCVGKADNKNPKGQMPGGSDNNAGYECDRNHGIGRSNPAHTGCVTTTPPVTSGTSGGTDTTCSAGMVLLDGACATPKSTTCPSGEEMVGLACVLGVSDSRNPGVTGGTVAGTSIGVPVSVLGERVLRAPGVAATATSLPFTGAPTGELVLLAVAALAAGGALAVAGRRRTNA